MERVRVTKSFSGVSRTKQSFRDECDINLIMKRFRKVCGADYLTRYSEVQSGSFGDFSEVKSYQEAIQLMDKVCDVFAGLPAKVRETFYNDPSNFVTFVNDPNNFDKAVELGIFERVKSAVSSGVEASQNTENADK